MIVEDRLIFLLFTAQQKLKTYLKNVMLSENVKVTVAQSGILFLLKAKNGQTMSELSQVLSLDNSTMTGLVDRLEKGGFVSRQSNPEDRRALLLYITESGLREVERAKAVIRRVNEEIKAGFTKEEIASFTRVLQHFNGRFRRAAEP